MPARARKKVKEGPKNARPISALSKFAFLGLEVEAKERSGEAISEIVSNLKAQNEKFIDKQFPRKLPKRLGTREWRSVSSLLQQPSSLYTQRRSVTTQMVEQGRLANCPTAVAVTNIASQPDLFDLIIPEKQYPDLGLNVMRIYTPEGSWEVLPLDDLCVVDDKMSPIFMRLVKENQVPLMTEKLLAKESGDGFLGLDSGGDTISPLVRLTGGSGWSERIQIQGDKELRGIYREMKRRVEEHFFVNLGSGEESTCKKVGVTSNHYLMFLRFEWITIFGHSSPIAIFKDPWGMMKDFKGALSPNRKLWSSLEREGKKLILQLKRQGLIYIELRELTAFNVINYFYPRLPTCEKGVVIYDGKKWIVDSVVREALGAVILKHTFEVTDPCLLILSLIKLTGVAQIGFKFFQKRDASGRAVETKRQFRGERLPHGYLEQGLYLRASPGIYEVMVYTPSRNDTTKVRLRLFQQLCPIIKPCMTKNEEQALFRYCKQVLQKGHHSS